MTGGDKATCVIVIALIAGVWLYLLIHLLAAIGRY